MLKLNEEGYRSTVGVSIKLHPEHETLSNALKVIRNKVYGVWTDVNLNTLFYLEKQAKKASHYAILDDQEIQDFILHFLRNKKVQLCVELVPFEGN